jgi:hypothetical protein
MIGLKLAREAAAEYQADYTDNVDDACGWANVLYRVKEDHASSG